MEDENEDCSTEPKCQGCNKTVQFDEYHSCPYQLEINDCDIQCNCCSDCEYQCSQDI